MLRLERLTKRFGEVLAVDDLALEVRQGEFLSLLGPSGCGKTTTLRMIAGFELPTDGRILLVDRDVTSLPPQRRGMGMVFQSYALFPHLNVGENVAFGLRTQGVPGAQIPGRVSAALERVDLGGYEKRPVQALSGGQQQRVALARALAPEPPLLLLDEPLSNLDAALRERTRTELRSLLKRVGITSIFVTHDQEEAFALSDRIAIMRGGRLQQHGTPEDLYRSPANAFVASFVGRANFLPGRVLGRENGHLVCEVRGGARWRVPTARPEAEGAEIRLMVRPEALRLVKRAAGDADHDSLPGRILDRRFAGAITLYRVEVPGEAELLVALGGDEPELDGEVGVAPAPGAAVHAFAVSDAP
jgi:putative spermidine/putrescine transport system ATP-binding protein